MDETCCLRICNTDDGKWSATHGKLDLHGATDAWGLFISSAVGMFNIPTKEGVEWKEC